ncbi:SLC13 family permease, partial [Escherichia coli O8:H10]
MDRLTPVRCWPAIIAIAITLTISFIIPVPADVTPEAWQLLALFIGTIAAIIGKAMPIGAIAIVAIMLVAMTGVTHPGKPSAALNDALSGFSNQLIWLIGLSIMLSQSLLKTGLGARIGYGFIALFGKRTLGIAWALTLAETLIAPVTPSNTARGGGIIHPIMRAIAESLGSQPGSSENGSTGRYLALVNYNINPISSAMFITATAPNPLIVSFLTKGSDGVLTMTWGMWAVAALLPAAVSLVVMPVVIWWLYPPAITRTPDAPRFARQRLD